MIRVLFYLCSASAASAVLINPGFETGNLSGWEFRQILADKITADNSTYQVGLGHAATRTGPSVADALEPQVVNLQPAAGTYYTALWIEHSSTSIGQPAAYLEQSLALTAGDVLSGAIACFTDETIPFFDLAVVRILDADGNVVAQPYSAWASVDVPAHDVNPAWDAWNWTAPVGGLFTLQLGLESFSDTQFPTTVYFDDINLQSSAESFGSLSARRAVPLPDRGNSALLALLISIGLVRATRIAR